jgi:hypothetical protein
MEALGTIEIRVQGIRGSEEISPKNLDIAELRDMLTRVEGLLFPTGGRKRPAVTYEMHEGSVRHVFRTSMQYAVMMGAVLSQIKATGSLDFLELNTAKAIEAFQEEAARKDWTFTLVTSSVADSPLTITRETHYVRNEHLLAKADFFFYGKITTLGGKSKGTIHIDTEEFGNLIIQTPPKELESLEENLLYHVLGVHASGLQNPQTGEIESGSLVFREFVQYEPHYDESYLNRLIEKARASWANGADVDEWLGDIRGYAHA